MKAGSCDPITAALDFTSKRYHKSVLPNVGNQNFAQTQMFRLLRDIITSSTLATLVYAAGPARAVDYFGFTLGMNEADALALAKSLGYEFQTDGKGLYFQSGRNGPDYLTFCDGRLFAVGKTFDGSLATFIGFVREWQGKWGEPNWKVDQSYATGVQPVKQVSSLKAQWDVIAEKFQPELTLLTSNNDLRISVSYGGQKYLCGGPTSARTR